MTTEEFFVYALLRLGDPNDSEQVRRRTCSGGPFFRHVYFEVYGEDAWRTSAFGRGWSDFSAWARKQKLDTRTNPDTHSAHT